jgi:hypothetical protein
VATLVGSAAIVTSRLIWNIPGLLYGGAALLVGSSIWNVRLKIRPESFLSDGCSTLTWKEVTS